MKKPCLGPNSAPNTPSRDKRLLRIAATVAILLVPISSTAAQAEGHGVAADNAWITFLKCQDLIGPKPTSINHEVFPIYSMWLRGYIAGVSSLAKISITEKVKFSEVAASVMMYCTTHQKETAVDASVHVTSLFYNFLNPQKEVTDLRNPGVPPLQE